MYRVFFNDNNILTGKDRAAGSIPNSIGVVPGFHEFNVHVKEAGTTIIQRPQYRA
ncbi:MAG: hypothetical protein Q7T53_00265 [Deltaproteobacteria bacterium]|nr:hypothetical protein [Deltaproteobacteria bacterium]